MVSPAKQHTDSLCEAAAAPADGAEVAHPIASQSAKPHGGHAVVLVGLMGAGKTKIGRQLAEAIGRRFIDSDEAIEAITGLTIADIFDLYGEASFRQTERREISRLLDRHNAGESLVLATGGGAFMTDETRKLIKARAFSVWLRAEPETLAARISNPASRPLLQGGDALDILSELASRRYPIYAEADLTITTDGMSLAEAAASVIQAVTSSLFSAGQASMTPET